MPSPASWSGRPATPELPPLIVIAGATATGKTALSLRLAEALPGTEIVCADSRQVYRGMDIGTAKPTAGERATVPHHGLDLVEPDVPCSAADYQRTALEALAGIRERGRIAMLVGGTGLYLRAVARGLPLDAADTDPQLRARLNERLVSEGLEVLVGELLERDPRAANAFDLHNPRRVVRALERALITGSALPPPARGYPAAVTWLGLEHEPAEHLAAIDSRVEAQFDSGLLDEAAALRERFPEDLAAFSAMGYREAFDVLAGRSSLAEAKAANVRRTRAYAKRQRTWFRSEPDVAWFAAGAELVRPVLDYLAPFLRAAGTAGYAGAR